MNGNDEAETAVLGACLLNRKAASLAGELLVPEDFSVPSRGLIFSAIQSVLTRLGQVDSLSVILELGDRAKD